MKRWTVFWLCMVFLMGCAMVGHLAHGDIYWMTGYAFGMGWAFAVFAAWSV